ncbi:MAG: PEP-CTERM sorting domain-containing protein, partial [Candidatus Brocadiales bacterium]
SIIIDLMLPASGTYFVQVGVFDPGVDTGNYELFMYTFTPVPDPGTFVVLGIGAVGLLVRRWRAAGGRELL